MAVMQPSRDYGSIGHKVWPWTMTRGALAVVFGILAFAWMLPAGTMAMDLMTWMIAGWAFVIGAMEIVANLIDRSSDHRDWVYGIVMGVVAVLFAATIAIMTPTFTAMITFAAVATSEVDGHHRWCWLSAGQTGFAIGQRLWAW